LKKSQKLQKLQPKCPLTGDKAELQEEINEISYKGSACSSTGSQKIGTPYALRFNSHA